MNDAYSPDGFLSKYGYRTPWRFGGDDLIEAAAKLKDLADSPELDAMSLYEAAALFYLMGYNQALHDQSPEG